ncbi:hypothetical protein LX36DRAFT_665003 [Colletotrichum falcatum]|nr:hypothetical protein LX36DRAFT_665003 [Colletotrichum falcatum]
MFRRVRRAWLRQRLYAAVLGLAFSSDLRRRTTFARSEGVSRPGKTTTQQQQQPPSPGDGTGLRVVAGNGRRLWIHFLCWRAVVQC